MPTENKLTPSLPEVKRWQLKGFIPGVEGESKAVFRPVVVLADDFDRIAAERDALQLRLNAADQRVDHLEGSLRRSASDYEGIDKLLMAFHDENKSQWCGYLDDALGACRYRRSETLNALKPAETERDQGIPGTSFQRLNMLANQGE